MRVLLDENVDPRLAPHLSDFDVSNVRDQGWTSIQNGELLRLAEQAFDVLVTRDKGLPHQQNLRESRLAIAVLRSPTGDLPSLLPLVPVLAAFLRDAQAGEVREIWASSE